MYLLPLYHYKFGIENVSSLFPCAKLSIIFDIKKKMTIYFHFYPNFML